MKNSQLWIHPHSVCVEVEQRMNNFYSEFITFISSLYAIWTASQQRRMKNLLIKFPTQDYIEAKTESVNSRFDIFATNTNVISDFHKQFRNVLSYSTNDDGLPCLRLSAVYLSVSCCRRVLSVFARLIDNGHFFNKFPSVLQRGFSICKHFKIKSHHLH